MKDRKIDHSQKRKRLTFHEELPFDESKIEPQHGYTCKLTSIATHDRFFSDNGKKFPCLPVHKGHRPGLYKVDSTKKAKNQPEAKVSLRELSKKMGSLQGELWDINQLIEILNNQLDYKSAIVNIDNIEQFRAIIIDEMSKNQPIIAFYKRIASYGSS